MFEKIKTFVTYRKFELLLIPIIVFLYVILYKIYTPRISAFGCFDDCNNFMRGYFFLNGNALFSEVFSGHQPFGSYLSALIQFITKPESLYELILRHRQFVILFGFLFNIFLVFRFGVKLIIFILLYEFSKFYIFGDRFLGEGMIVYPAVYLCGLVILKIRNEKIYKADYILSALFCWFIVFFRSPFVPLAVFLFGSFLWIWPIRKVNRLHIISLILFVALSSVTLLLHDLKEYFSNVVAFNYTVNIPAESELDMFGPKIFQWFLYPLYIFFYGPLNTFKILLICLNTVFLVLFLNLIFRKKIILALFIFVALGLSNLRPAIPGELFLGSFHMVVWYGLFIFSIIMFLFDKKVSKRLFYPGIIILVVSLFMLVASPNYFAREKVDPHTEFINNYGYILQQGEAIKVLSKPGDTLFLDGSDDMIYWQSGLFSDYRYSWYTSSMSYFDKYNDERIEMFKKTPPDFYREHGRCPKVNDQEGALLPDFIREDYIRLFENGEASCIYIHKDKISEITKDQKLKAAEWLYTIPDETN